MCKRFHCCSCKNKCIISRQLFDGIHLLTGHNPESLLNQQRKRGLVSWSIWTLQFFRPHCWRTLSCSWRRGERLISFSKLDGVFRCHKHLQAPVVGCRLSQPRPELLSQKCFRGNFPRKCLSLCKALLV